MLRRHEKLIEQMHKFAVTLPPPMQRRVVNVLHKVANPMATIMAKVPGESIADKATKVGVSRQTVYVWMAERCRPTLAQAKRISKYTGIPAEDITGDVYDTRAKIAAKAARVAKRRERDTERAARTTSTRRGEMDAGSGVDAA